MTLLVPPREAVNKMLGKTSVCIECGSYRDGVGWPECDHTLSVREFDKIDCVFSKDGRRVIGIRRGPGQMTSPNVGTEKE